MSDGPLILWFRRDLRLADHPMLTAAVQAGRAVVPVVILDPQTEAQGAAALWRWGLAVAAFDKALAALGVRLTLRRGAALAVLRGLVAETGASGVWWTRLYDPVSRERDEAVKTALLADGVEARSFAGHLLHEPWEVQTGEGGFYKVFTPFWRAVRQLPVRDVLPTPTALRAGPLVPAMIWRSGIWNGGCSAGRRLSCRFSMLARRPPKRVWRRFWTTGWRSMPKGGISWPGMPARACRKT